MEAWIKDLRESCNNRKKKNKRIKLVIMFMCVITVFFIYKYAVDRKEISLNINGTTRNIVTYENNIKEILENEQITLFEEDQLIPDKNARVKDGMKINIYRAFPVFINVNEKRYQCKTTSSTVKEILQNSGVQINSSDIVTPNLNTVIKKSQIIEIVRVIKKETIETERIPYKTVYIKDSNLEKGKSKVIQNGKDGKLEKTISITYYNGKEFNKEIISKEIIEEPVNKKVKIGTKTKTTVNGENLSFSKNINLTATAYTYTGSKTFTGRTPKKGIAAVDPDIIPLGTELYIKGYGYATADDIGSAIQGSRIDLFMETKEQALSWGVREVEAFILE